MGAAGAPTLSPDETVSLRAGAAVVRVEPDRSEKGAAGAVFGAVEIEATPDRIWAVMTDCARAPQFVPHLESCEILDASADGRSDLRRHVIDYGFPLPKISIVFRSDYDAPHVIAFERAGGDLRIMEGVWRIEAGDRPGVARLFYDARLAIGLPVPRGLIRRNLRRDTPRILLAVKHEAESAGGGR